MSKPIVLEYEITRQDYVLFNLHYVRTNPAMRRTLLLSHIVPPLCFAILPFFIQSAMSVGFVPGFIVFGLATILWLAFWRPWFRRIFVRRIHRVIDEGKLNGIVGRHRTTLTDEALSDQTDASETTFRTIERVEVAGDRLYVWVSPVMAFIVPRAAFGNPDEERRFTERAERLKGEGTASDGLKNGG